MPTARIPRLYDEEEQAGLSPAEKHLSSRATGKILDQPLREDFGYWAVGR